MDQAIENLVSAVEKGRTDIVRSIIEACEKCGKNEGEIEVDKLLNSLTSSEGSVLHLATRLGEADIVRTLLSAGADPGVHNNDGHTPLDLATSSKVCDVFSEELLQATAASNIGRVCQLLAAGVSINVLDSPESRNTPLHWAATYGNRDIVQCLCKRNANVNMMNSDGATPLHDAIMRADMAIVEELLMAGASVNIRPHDGVYKGQTVMDLAAERPDLMTIIEKSRTPPVVNGLAEDNLSELDPNSTPVRKTDTVINGNHTANGPLLTPQLSDSALSKRMSDLLLYPGTTTPPDSLVTDGHLHLLWPKPQKLVQKEGQHFIAKDELIVLVAATPAENLHSICDCWHRQVMVIRDLGLDLVVEPFINGVPQHPHIICEINTRLFTKLESCRITVTDKMIKIQASDVTGMFYAMHTTLQLIRLCGKDGIPPLQIQDWPSLRDRGVLLDLSKGRIPTLESLRTFIEILAGLKVNQVQLYMRFKSLREADTPWQLPYSPSEILNVSWLCKHYHMMLAPVIDVAPSVSYDDLPQLYNSFLQFSHCFTNASVIGVGPRLSSLLVDTDNGHLRLDDVHRLLPVSTNQIVQLCAFVFHDSLDSLTQFPFSTMVMEYGFQANYDFEKLSKLYSENGVPFSVMPGTAAWNSLAGCPEAAVGNMHSAITSAASHGALGMVAAHWAGVGHMTHQCISWPGFLTAAGLAWNCNIRCDFLHANLSELLNQILVDEAGTAGQVIVELGRAETYILRCARNQQGNDDNDLPAEKGSTLYQLLSHPDQVSLENLTMEAFQRAMRHIRKCQSELSKCRMLCEQGPEIQAELQVTADLMLSACRIGRALVYVGRNPGGQQTGYAVINLGVANLPATHKTDLANRMLTQIDTYQRVWQMRQLETSLADSVAILNNSLKQFLPDQVMPEMAAPVLNGEVED